MHFSKFHIFWTKKDRDMPSFAYERAHQNLWFFCINQKKYFCPYSYIYFKKLYFQNFIDCPTVQFFNNNVLHCMRCYLDIYLLIQIVLIITLAFFPFFMNFLKCQLFKGNFCLLYDLKSLKMTFCCFLIFFSNHRHPLKLDTA